MDFSSRLNKLLKQSSEFKSWFLVFGCFPRVFIILGLFLLFWISFKIVQFSWHCGDWMLFRCDFKEKSANIRAGIWLKTSVVEVCNSKTVQTCRSRRLNWLKKNGFLFSKFNLIANPKWTVDSDGDVKSEEKGAVLEDYVHNEENEKDSEDGEFDVTKLRELVKIERKHKKEALEELEKERMAAATSAEEAMAMIFRLQHEKSAIEIQANQFRRMMEQKQQYHQEVIECLQRIIMEYESEGSLSEQPCICRPKEKLQLIGFGDGTSLFERDMEFILEDDDALMNNIGMDLEEM
ncbi:protein FLOURY 1-like [Cucurbita pepo subsp. pepo]|uniref:protein FLOURY 1-like n=1 Tax=Cucurbita pepo subsp. pepo TaxID=3664 RepID=UPI000C9D5610|nr:protein FLOURY 1-like [Cucurbita pepo subsp. pepo]